MQFSSWLSWETGGSQQGKTGLASKAQGLCSETVSVVCAPQPWCLSVHEGKVSIALYESLSLCTQAMFSNLHLKTLNSLRESHREEGLMGRL